MKKRRLKRLIEHDISMLGYHLPLDAHPELGNNAQLAKRLGLITEGFMNAEHVGNYGRLETPMTLEDFAAHIETALGRQSTVVNAGSHQVSRVAWCTGGAQGYLHQAAALDVDAYISGEISEQTTHEARENGVHYIAAGHHATERYGAQALAEHLATEFGLEHQFIDVDNPA